ncbi:MAG TPA: hypothetical protein VGM30_05690 [Puia sp.]|jgi:hypothetical protein
MSSELKKNEDKKKQSTIIPSKTVGDYREDPAFKKMADESKIFLDRVGFPEELLKKK